VDLEEERRAEQRTQASLVRQLGALSVRRSRWRRSGSTLGSLAEEQARVRAQLEVCAERLALLDAELQAIQRREQQRAGWFADTHDLLARGVAAMHVLETRQREAQGKSGGAARPTTTSQHALRVIA
jgi:hypothetical protein